MNLERLRRVYLNSGYTLANASAKICQDIILNKISKSKMNKNIIIKGGVVMHNLSDARNNWLQVAVNEVITGVVIYFENLETVQV